MKPEEEYIEINKASWNKRTAAHLTSDFYDVEGFLNGRNPLNDIELNLLGDIKGKSIFAFTMSFWPRHNTVLQDGSEGDWC